MLSKEAILKAGARHLLVENERERETLLKILNEKPSQDSSNGIRSEVRRHIKTGKKVGAKKGKKHWTQTPAGREKMRQQMLIRHAEKRSK